MMEKLKPRAYLDEYYPSSGYCPKTVTNWIKSGKIKGEITPTGRYLVLVDPTKSANNVSNPDNVNSLVQKMKGQGM